MASRLYRKRLLQKTNFKVGERTHWKEHHNFKGMGKPMQEEQSIANRWVIVCHDCGSLARLPFPPASSTINYRCHSCYLKYKDRR